jgi:cardiolipin synthase A/B
MIVSYRPPIDCEVAGNRLRLLPGGLERFEALIDMIETARESIRVIFYMFTEDAVGTRVLNALTQAAARGVEVRLLLDEFGCGAIRQGFLEPLRDAGGQYCVFHPTLSRRYLIRNHQKMVVADGKGAIIGGANINEHYLTDEGPKHWRDLWLAVDGPAVGQLADYFDDIYLWTAHPKPLVKKLRRIIAKHSRGSGPIAWRFSGPIAKSNPWPVQVVKDILAAKQVDIVAAYFLTRCCGGSARWSSAAAKRAWSPLPNPTTMPPLPQRASPMAAC